MASKQTLKTYYIFQSWSIKKLPVFLMGYILQDHTI